MNAETDAVCLERVLPASPGRVFDAWTRPDWLALWWTPPSTGLLTEVEALDPVVGGALRLSVHAGTQVVARVWGVFEQVERPRVLAFTWNSDGDCEGATSRVTVSLRPHPRGCALTLVHSQGPPAQAEPSWRAMLANLSDHLQGSP
ncbi:MAG: SRPBCC domain-containing protein [Alphaproteobacteria bacterium]|nr:SRPBCC domain-containing protein [Alphaproteobacteria bacterium]